MLAPYRGILLTGPFNNTCRISSRPQTSPLRFFRHAVAGQAFGVDNDAVTAVDLHPILCPTYALYPANSPASSAARKHAWPWLPHPGATPRATRTQFLRILHRVPEPAGWDQQAGPAGLPIPLASGYPCHMRQAACFHRGLGAYFKTILARLLRAASLTPPRPASLIRMAEECR